MNRTVLTILKAHKLLRFKLSKYTQDLDLFRFLLSKLCTGFPLLALSTVTLSPALLKCLFNRKGRSDTWKTTKPRGQDYRIRNLVPASFTDPKVDPLHSLLKLDLLSFKKSKASQHNTTDRSLQHNTKPAKIPLRAKRLRNQFDGRVLTCRQSMKDPTD